MGDNIQRVYRLGWDFETVVGNAPNWMFGFDSESVKFDLAENIPGRIVYRLHNSQFGDLGHLLIIKCSHMTEIWLVHKKYDPDNRELSQARIDYAENAFDLFVSLLTNEGLPRFLDDARQGDAKVKVAQTCITKSGRPRIAAHDWAYGQIKIGTSVGVIYPEWKRRYKEETNEPSDCDLPDIFRNAMNYRKREE